MTNLIISFIAGFLAGIILMFIPYKNLTKKQTSLKKKFERTSIGADDSELRVKTLENKVKTLEAALEKTLKNKE